ncbi:hypothetical protein F4780DRAFT_402211 [Xylariomycetidae sp. FL0641]|nr:hypothetical protein F4780DRAFT_402211 [Xylariomycetidae sp. FL0641]
MQPRIPLDAAPDAGNTLRLNEDVAAYLTYIHQVWLPPSLVLMALLEARAGGFFWFLSRSLLSALAFLQLTGTFGIAATGASVGEDLYLHRLQGKTSVSLALLPQVSHPLPATYLSNVNCGKCRTQKGNGRDRLVVPWQAALEASPDLGAFGRCLSI